MSGMRYQPQGAIRLNQSHPLARRIVEYLPLCNNISSGLTGRMGVVGPAGAFRASPIGLGLRGSGAGGRGSMPLNLTKYGVITFAFWMYWDAFANNDALAFEFTSNGATRNGGGFAFNPNSSGPGLGKLVFFGNTTNSVDSFATSWARPSAAAWHRYVLVLSVTGSVELYIDGKIQPKVVESNPAQSGNFSDSNLHLLCRNQSSLFASGNLQDLAIYNGALSEAEVLADYRNPWQLFADPDDDDVYIALADGATSGSFASTLSNVACNAAGSVVNAGSLTASLGNTVMSSLGLVGDIPSGSFSTALNNATMTASGQLLYIGSIGSTLSGAGFAASGNVAQQNTGEFAAVMQGVSMAAYGYEGAAPVATESKRYRWRILRRHQSQ